MLPQKQIQQPDPFDADVDQLGKDFQTKYGRSWEITGGSDTPAHQRFRKGKARDIRSHNLKREEMDYLISRGAELNLTVKDFSHIKQPFTNKAGVRFTGPHLHIERNEDSLKFGGEIDSIMKEYGLRGNVEAPKAAPPADDFDTEIDSILTEFGVRSKPSGATPSQPTPPAIWNREDPGYATKWNVQRMIDEGVEETKHLPGSTKLIESNGQPVPLHQPVSVSAPSPYRFTVAGLGDDTSKITPESLRMSTLQALGFPESAAKNEAWEFRIPHEDIIKRINNGSLEVDIPQDEADYLRGRAEEAKRVDEFLKTARNGGELTAEQIAEAANKPGIIPRVEPVSTVTGRAAQKPLPYDVEREVAAKTTLGDLPELATRPLQYVSTLTAGVQRGLGAEISDMLGLSKNARADYGPMDILDAAAERFYTGKVRPGYEQPVAELYKALVTRYGGDPDSAFNKFMRDTLELGTDPVNIALMGAGGAKLSGPKTSEVLLKQPVLNRATIPEVITSMRKAGFLTGLKTQARNILGNASFQAAEELSRMPASLVDMGMGVLTGRRTVQGFSPQAFARATRSAATEGLEEARNIMKTGATPSQLVPYGVTDEMVSGLPILDSYVNTTFRLQAAEDVVFKRYAATRSLQEQATLMAKSAAKSGLIKKAAIDARAKEIIEGIGVNPDEFALMQARAAEDAAFATFQNPNWLADKAEKAIQGWPTAAKFTADMVMPFRKTPTNIIARILDYSPVGAAKGSINLANSLLKGAFSPAEQRAFAQAMGRATTGTAAIMLGYKLREKGLLTGGVREGWTTESNKEAANQRRLLEAEGKIPGALRIGDKWVEVAKYSPLGNLLALGAAMYDRSEQGENLASAGAKEIGNAALDQPLVEGLKDLPQIYNDPERYAQNMVGSFVPTIASDVAGQLDTTERSTGEEIYGAAQKRMPGLREQLPVRVNIFGEQMEPSSNLNPLAMRDAKDMPAVEEIKRLGLDVYPPERFPADTDQIYLTRAKKQGEARRQNLQAVTSSEKYSNLSDSSRRALLREAINTERPTDEILLFHNGRVREEREAALNELRQMPEYAGTDDKGREILERAINSAYFNAKAERYGNDGGINLLLNRKEQALSRLDRKKIINEALEEMK